MKSFLNIFARVGTLGMGMALLSYPASATQMTDLEYIEAEVNASYKENHEAGEEILEPVYIDGETVDVEIFGSPEPDAQAEVFEATLPQERKVGGVEIIQLSVPAE